MTYGQGAALQTFAFRFHFVGLIRAVFTYTMTKSQCFDMSSSPDKCDGEERRGGFQKAHEKEKKNLNDAEEGREVGGMSTGSGAGKYLILPKPT